eukprot:COSAG06_NODE_29786_length_550_cov_1.057650_2_plen_88_part_00
MQEVVARLAPDILNMVEVEGCEILTRLAGLLLPAGGGGGAGGAGGGSGGLQPFLLRGTDTFLGQNAGEDVPPPTVAVACGWWKAVLH